MNIGALISDTHPCLSTGYHVDGENMEPSQLCWVICCNAVLAAEKAIKAYKYGLEPMDDVTSHSQAYKHLTPTAGKS